MRDLGQIGTAAHIPKGSIRVVLNDTQGQQVAAKLFTGTDTYGAFHGSFTLPETAPLGTYYMVYEFEGQQSRSHDLRVQEFQKASFEMKPQLITSGTKVLLTVEPTYYFGSPVDTYDLDIDRSVAGENACRRCRRWNTDDYYFNHVFGQQISTGGALGFLQV
ncbi:MAG: hypothetical protein Q8O99_04615 [bacterium]|nr:hypothetical protein [bacterium]